MDFKHWLATAALALCGAMAAAQTQAPGLWEHTVDLKSADGEVEMAVTLMRQQLAAMSPEQRAQMETMLARRGVSLGATGTVMKACVTADEAAQPAAPKLGANCTQQIVSRSGATLKLTFACSRPQPLRGEGEVTFDGERSYTGHAAVTMPFLGKPRQMTMTLGGRWLGADCGNVRPLPAPAPAPEAPASTAAAAGHAARTHFDPSTSTSTLIGPPP